MTIGIAVLGAGIFARDEHVPAIQACKSLSLKAIYSRSQASSETLANSASVDAYYDSPPDPSKNLSALLARDDIQAVVIALPITVQPEIIKQALAAGKHVLSEKPIAKDVATAQDLISWHENNAGKTIWGVAENFRFLEVTKFAGDKLKEIGGEVATFNLQLYACIDANDKFFQTPWRQVPEYQGGFLLDGGVHFVAGLRYLLAAAKGNQQITHLAAFTSLLQEKLAPVDTVHSTMRISNGNNGTFSVSFGTEFKSGFEIEVVTQNGAVKLTPTQVVVTTKEAGEKKEEKKEFEYSSGVKPEMVAFAEAIENGVGNEMQSPKQAFMDLKILQSLLESGEQSGKVLEVAEK